MGELGQRGLYVDPFDLYGLDSDVAPKRIDSENAYEKRDIPVNAWDGFAANRLDRQEFQHIDFSAIRGHWATNVPRLPARLAQIGVWICKVADQPTTAWWAAHENGLHPSIQARIRWDLERSNNEFSSVIRLAWRYLFEAWEEMPQDFHRDWYELKPVIDKDGWDRAAVRRYVSINRPYLRAEPNHRRGPKPPEWTKKFRVRDLLRLQVEYPNPPNDLEIPDKWLEPVVHGLRKNLEHALDLETELGGYVLNNIESIIPDDGRSDGQYGRTHGLSGSVISFSSHFERLAKFDIDAAKRELTAWSTADETIFSRLRIWASGMRELVSGQMLCSTISGLSDDAFWNRHHQRDLLLVLAKRWSDLTKTALKKIETRLLRGPNRWTGEESTEYGKRRAWSSLNRITWLANNGCKFSFDLTVETKELKCKAIEWKAEYSTSAAESMGSRGGFIRIETEYSSLLREPLSSMLSKALELRKKTDEFLVERDPFAGLSAKRPVRAFAALTNAAKRTEFPEWAWHTFLSAEIRAEDKPKFSALIAERISRYPDEAVARIIGPASDWILNSRQKLASCFTDAFDRVISKLIHALCSQPSAGVSAISRHGTEPDWATEAINSPVGKIARALFNDPRIDDLKVDEVLPVGWLTYCNDLLSLSGDPRRYALAILAHNLGWFYSLNRQWTETKLLSVLESESGYDQEAVWSGFFLGSSKLYRDLFIRIKPNLLAVAKGRSLAKREYGEVLAGIILSGWGSRNGKTQERLISNDEMRDVLLYVDDDFRCRILWQVERWSKNQEAPAGEKWPQMLAELLRDVWPRQKSVKTPAVSAALCDLAFSNVERFPEIADIVLPLLTKIDQNHVRIPNLRNSKDTTDLYPHRTLALLYAVLPDNVAAWPFAIEETLERIGEAANDLRRDEKLIELNRKWNAR